MNLRLRRRLGARPDRDARRCRVPADERDAHHRGGGVPEAQEMARKLGAVDVSNRDPVNGILCLTAGRGVNVANEALGRQETFAAVLLVLRPGETLSSPRVCSTDPMVPLGAFAAGLGDLHRTIGSPSIISRRRAISSF